MLNMIDVISHANKIANLQMNLMFVLMPVSLLAKMTTYIVKLRCQNSLIACMTTQTPLILLVLSSCN